MELFLMLGGLFSLSAFIATKASRTFGNKEEELRRILRIMRNMTIGTQYLP
jgi:hypothetical protein